MFVRYRNDTDFVEQMLFCQPLVAARATGKEVFKTVDSFLCKHEISWNNCIAVCADGAPVMMGHKKGFLSYVLQKNKNILAIHCFLHRENLAARHSQGDMAIVFKEIVDIVNYIKKSALCTRLFGELCDETDADFRRLLFYSKVRWLSKGKVLHRVVALRGELHTFLSENNHQLASRFADKMWVAKMVFFPIFLRI